MGKWKELAGIHTCHADCQRPACVAARQAAEIHTCSPQREWQGLTDEEIEDLWGEPVDLMYSGHYNAILAIEAKLKEKNT